MEQFLGLESERSENLSKQDIINNVALMIRDGKIDEHIGLLGCKTKEEFEELNPDLDYYEELAKANLENIYNKECMYSPQEHLLYLAGAYSRQWLLEEVSKSDDEKMQQRHSKEIQIAIEGYNAEKLGLCPYIGKNGIAVQQRIREIDEAIRKLLAMNK